MVEGDVFREVEEDLRRERIKALWDRYGGYVLIGALAIILLVGGKQAYDYWTREQARAAGLAYAEAGQLIDEGKAEEGTAALERIAAGSGGYAALAKLRLAALKAKEGAGAEAIALYDEITKAGAGDQAIRTMARFRAAMLSLEANDFTGVKNRLTPLLDASNPWRHSARELVAMAEYKAGDRETAEGHFQEILGDVETPDGLRRRAQTMLELIVRLDAKSPESGATGSSGSAGATAPASQGN